MIFSGVFAITERRDMGLDTSSEGLIFSRMPNMQVQWNLVITRSLGLKITLYACFLYQGKRTKKYKELGPAKLPCYKRVLLYPTSL